MSHSVLCSENTIPRPLHIEVCPACAEPFRPGELSCAKCGMVFSHAGKTHKIARPEHIDSKSWMRTAESVADKTIIFEIGELSLAVPTAQEIVIGRTVVGSPSPDVDLTEFDAQNKGVSRHHIKIIRDVLIYVTDLASTNGTFLNGQKLFAYSECPLNQGDELWLGHLKIKVQFRKSGS